MCKERSIDTIVILESFVLYARKGTNLHVWIPFSALILNNDYRVYEQIIEDIYI